MVEREKGIVIKEITYSEGEVVLVLRDVGTDLETGQEEAGFIHDIEPGGRVFIDYGGVISLLHDEDQIRKAPEDIREILELRLKQNRDDLQKDMLKFTKELSKALEEYNETSTFFKWIRYSIKSMFRKKTE